MYVYPQDLNQPIQSLAVTCSSAVAIAAIKSSSVRALIFRSIALTLLHIFSMGDPRQSFLPSGDN